jgi:hypothetical protein
MTVEGLRLKTGMTDAQRAAWSSVVDHLAVLEAWQLAEERTWIDMDRAEHQGPAARNWATARHERCQEQIRAAQKDLDRVRSQWEAVRPGAGHQ